MKIEDCLFQLKFAGKQFERQAKKAKKEEKKEKKNVKKAIEKGNIDGARVYAQNAIRKKNEELNFLRLASRLDGVAGRLDTAVKMNQVSKSMGGVVKGMDKVLKTMDPERISKIMEKFEQQFEDMDVTSSHMESSMAESTSVSTPEDQVNTLMAEVADEHGLEMAGDLSVKSGGANLDSVQQDELSQRLASLKGNQ
eukprot:gb/GECH01011990.1/.p1 GENE.gb/GECH01011990.1/~~gb/GECH01011990.1/.p1  ORF type:complete len:196 (+),score=68.82 gb/GECH01011990.1/:1-588(+)